MGVPVVNQGGGGRGRKNAGRTKKITSRNKNLAEEKYGFSVKVGNSGKMESYVGPIGGGGKETDREKWGEGGAGPDTVTKGVLTILKNGRWTQTSLLTR